MREASRSAQNLKDEQFQYRAPKRFPLNKGHFFDML